MDCYKMKNNQKNKNKKICFAASSGGHYEQLMMLAPLMDQYDSFILTEKTVYLSQVEGKKTYLLRQVNRKEWNFIFSMLLNTLLSALVFMKERPNVIICTGVLSTIPMCMIGKFFGKRLIYIESFAKITSATETGKFMYKYADYFYVQWEEMLAVYPNAIYLGGIY